MPSRKAANASKRKFSDKRRSVTARNNRWRKDKVKKHLLKHRTWSVLIKRSRGKEMPFIVKDTGGGYTPPPAGNHIARCVRIIDLGTTYNEMYNKKRRQIFIGWELPNETVEVDGKKLPVLATKYYGNSLSPASDLSKHLESWRGRSFTSDERQGFNIEKILGLPCMLNIIHKEKQSGGVKAEITSVTAIPGGVTVPDQVNESIVFSLQDPDMNVFKSLSERIQAKIMESEEWKALNQEAPHDPSGMDKLYNAPASQVDEGPDW